MNKLRQLWESSKSSLWFVPTLMIVGAIALAVGLVEAEGLVSRELLAGYPRLFGAGVDAARGMLSAIAGSMITVAGLTFSLTIVAITQASSQYTPRVLRNFIRDRHNQFVLGYFIAVFVFCLVVLRTIRGGEDDGRFIPSLAVFGGLLLAILSVGVLVSFIHHTASSLQASSIISNVAKETVETIERLFPERIDLDSKAREDFDPAGELSGEGWQEILAAATGYIQSVNMNKLLELAEEHDVVLRMKESAGGYVVKGAPLLYVAENGKALAGAAELREKLNDCYTFDHFRTIERDAAFGIRQLVDIALKALSPGVNDTTTAITCVDYLGAILAECAVRRMENHLRGADRRVRVVACRPMFAHLVAEAFDQIRDSGEDNAAVLLRQLKAIETTGGRTRSASRRQALLEQVGLIADAMKRGIKSEYNRTRINERIERVGDMLDANRDTQIYSSSETVSESQNTKETVR